MPHDPVYKDRNLQLMFGVTLMAVQGISSITPAFPRIVEELQIKPTDVGLLIVAFTIPTVLLTPLFGILGDRFGRKRVLLPCLFLFSLAGGACALTKDFTVLLALRALQGAGAAGLAGLSLTIVSDLFSGQRRAEAMGLRASVLSTGTTFYPLLGGALATFSWQYPFLMALAGLPLGLLLIRSLNNPEPRSQESFARYLGSAWGYMRNMRILAAFLAGVMAFTLLYGAKLTYLPLYLDAAFKASPFIIGVITSTMSVATIAVSAQLGRLSRAMSVVTLVKLGFTTCALALAAIPFVPSLVLLVIPAGVFGAGFAVIFPSLQTYVAGLAPAEYRSAFMSIISMMFRVGQTLGPPVIGLAFVLGDYRGAFLFGAVLALATAGVGAIGGKLLR